MSIYGNIYTRAVTRVLTHPYYGEPWYGVYVWRYDDDAHIGSATLKDSSFAWIEPVDYYDFPQSFAKCIVVDLNGVTLSDPNAAAVYRLRVWIKWCTYIDQTNAWQYRDHYAYAVKVNSLVDYPNDPLNIGFRISQCSPLGLYDSDSGTYTTSSAYGNYQSSEVYLGAYMAQCDPVEQIYIGNYLPTYEPGLTLPYGKIHDNLFVSQDQIQLGGTGQQFPMKLPMPRFEDGAYEASRRVMELEFKVTDSSLVYNEAYDSYDSIVYFNVGFMGYRNGVGLRGSYGSFGILFRVHNTVDTGPGQNVSNVRCLHNLSAGTIVMGSGNILHRRSLFGLQGVPPAPRQYASGSIIQRVRQLPRFRANLVLLQQGSSSPYTYAVHVEDANATWEVVSVTGVAGLIEVAPDRREALLIVQTSANRVYAYKSTNMGWSFHSGTQCNLGGNPLTVAAIYDLDYSVRRRVYLLTATISGSLKLLMSEDGINWTDTGV